jgi:hypothetical protein
MATYGLQGTLDKSACSKGLFFQPNTAKEVMRHALHLFLCDLVRDDRQAMVQLHRISVDDFAIVLQRYLHRQLLLSVSRCVV